MTKTVGSVEFAGKVIEITDTLDVQPVSADLIVEGRVYSGIVCLSFACLTLDGNGAPSAKVNARLRFTLPGAMDLRNSFDNLLKAEMPGKETAN